MRRLGGSIRNYRLDFLPFPVRNGNVHFMGGIPGSNGDRVPLAGNGLAGKVRCSLLCQSQALFFLLNGLLQNGENVVILAVFAKKVQQPAIAITNILPVTIDLPLLCGIQPRAWGISLPKLLE